MLDQLQPTTEQFTSPTGLRVRQDLYDEDYSDEDYERMLSMYEGTMAQIVEGEIVKSKVLRVTDNAVILDVGFKSEGSVPLDEFKDPQSLKEGDEKFPSVLAGPTCDSIDVIAENLMLPALKAGDLIVGRAMGAYTWASATDFNFYTKRGLLAGVYTATLFFWLNDKSEGCAATWGILDRRIDEAMRLPQALGRLGKITERLPFPRRLFRRPFRAARG